MPTPLKQRTRISVEDKVKVGWMNQIKCTACDDKSVVDWSCKECDEKLCAFCYKAHIRVKLTQNHALSKL